MADGIATGMRAVLVGAMLLAPLAARAGDGTVPEVLVPEDRRAYQAFGFAPAVRVGDMLYLSGVTGAPVARDADDDALEANFVSIFEQVKAVLARAGATFDNVVLMRTYRLDYLKNFPIFKAVKERYVNEPYPAWVDIGIDALPPGAMAELEVQAWLGGARREAE